MTPLLVRKTLCLFEVRLQETSIPPCAARLPVTYRCLDAAAWAAQPQVEHIPDRYVFAARLAHGEQFWTAQQGTKIVSYCWAAHAAVEIGEIQRRVRPRADEIYLYDAFTFTEYRGQNLYPALLRHILVHSRQRRLRRALIFVLSDNAASIRGVRKAGFREFQRLIFTNALGFTRYALRPSLCAAAGVDLLPA